MIPAARERVIAPPVLGATSGALAHGRVRNVIFHTCLPCSR